MSTTPTQQPIPTEQYPWPKPKYTFETVKGYFLYDDEQSPPQLASLEPNFGLREGKTWIELLQELKELNQNAEPGVQYKLIYAGRHGQGYHNVANDMYRATWDQKEATQFGDGSQIWGPDPELTPLGVQQAQAINEEWIRLLSPDNPDKPLVPTRLISSPFRRSAVTLLTAWDHVLKQFAIRPVIRELWREHIWNHTCDWRSPKSVIAQRVPEFELEEGMTEDEVLPDQVVEKEETVYIRILSALSQTFEEFPDDLVLGISFHSNAMRGLFMAVNHNVFKPRICSFIPLIIKATPV